MQLSQALWHEILSNPIVSSSSVILVGDYNSNHISWNCDHNDNDGISLLSAIDSAGLLVHNLDSLSHIDVARNKKSNINLIITSRDISELINQQIFDEPLGSDHFHFNISFSADRYIYRREIFRLHSKRIDWAKFSENLAQNFDKLNSLVYSNSSGVEKYEIWFELVSNAVKISTPIRKDVRSSVYQSPVSWWDDECYKLKRL